MILVIIQGLCHRKLEFMFPLWLLLHWVQQSVTLNYRTKVTTPASWRICMYVHSYYVQFTYHSDYCMIAKLRWRRPENRHFKDTLQAQDETDGPKNLSYFGRRDVWGKKMILVSRIVIPIKELKNLVLHLDQVTWFFFFARTNFSECTILGYMGILHCIL